MSIWNALILVTCCTVVTGYGQNIPIFSETFDYPNGTTEGPVWIATGTLCVPGGVWGVQDGRFRAQHVDGECCMEGSSGLGNNSLFFANIRVSDFSCIELSVQLIAGGAMESTYDNATFDCDPFHDQAIVEYNAGAGWTPFQTNSYLTGNFGTVTARQVIPNSGNVISIRILIKTSGEDDIIEVDNVTVEGCCLLGNFNPTVTDPNCAQSDGSIDLTTSGPNLEYQLDEGNWTANPIFTNLPAGNYNVSVRESESTGCVRTETVQLEESNPELLLNILQPDCGSDNGRIEVSSDVPSTFSFTGPMGSNGSSTNGIFNNLGVGMYQITAISSADPTCMTTVTRGLSASPNFTSTAFKLKDPSCIADDGEVQIQVMGPGTYEFALLNREFQSDSIIDNLPVGDLQFLIRDVMKPSCIDTVSESFSSFKPQLEPENITTSGTSCTNGNGDVTIQVSGTNLEFSVDSGRTWQSENQFNDISFGRYHVFVRSTLDQTCFDQEIYYVQDIGTPIIESISLVEPGCKGAGQAIIKVANRNPAFEYSIDNFVTTLTHDRGDSTITFPIDSAGRYVIHAINPSKPPRCNTPYEFDIDSSKGPTLTNVIAINPDCGEDNGSITLFSNQDNVQFLFDNGQALSDSNRQEGLNAGLYNLVVQDQNFPSCRLDTSIELSNTALPSFPSFIINNGDCGGREGSIAWTTDVQNPEYLWNGELIANDDLRDSVANLQTGTYTFSVRDVSTPTCQYDTTFFVIGAVTPPVLSDISIQNADCGGSLGSISITASGFDLEYQLDNDSIQSSPEFQELDGGEYLLSILESVDPTCRTDTTIIIRIDGAPIIENIDIRPVSCSGITGQILVEAIGNNGLLYILDTLQPRVQPNFDSVHEGPHSIRITEASDRSCFVDTTVFMPMNELPGIDSLAIIPDACATSSGLVEVFSPDSNLYLVINSDFSDTSLIGGLASGEYLLEVTRANDMTCLTDTIVFVPAIESPQFQALELTPANCNTDDGRITIQVNSDVDYLINGAFTTSDITNLPPGDYIITIQSKASQECSADTTITLTRRMHPETPEVNVIEPTCGQENGSIAILNAADSIIYSYVIDSLQIIPDSSLTFTNLSAGFYAVEARVLGNPECIATTTVELLANDAPKFGNILIEEPDCGQSNGSISIANPDNLIIQLDGLTSESSVFSDLGAGSYWLQGSQPEDTGCITDTLITLAGIGDIMIDGISLFHPTCGENNGTIMLNYNASIQNLEFSINGGRFLPTNRFNLLAPGTYQVNWRDPTDTLCVSGRIASLEASTPINLQEIVITDASCGLSDGSISIITLDSALTFLLNGEEQASNQIDSLSAGQYLLTISDGSCSLDTTLIIQQDDGPRLDSISITPVNCRMDDGSLEVFATGSNLEYSLNGNRWSSDPFFVFLASKTYSVFVRESTNTNCVIRSEIFVPQGITPIIDSIRFNQTGCSGDRDELIVFASGDQLQYSLDGINFQSEPAFTKITSSLQSIFLRSALDPACIVDTLIELPIRSAILDSIVITEPSCFASNTGTIELMTRQPITVSWGHDANLTSLLAEGLPSGTFFFDIISEDCRYSDTVVIPDPLPFLVDCGPTMDFNGFAMQIENGNLPVSIIVTGDTVFQINLDTNYFAVEQVGGGEYQIQAEDAKGCVSGCAVIIPDRRCNLGITTDVQPEICGQMDGSIQLLGVDETDPFVVIDWSVDSLDNRSAVTNLVAGEYSVIVTERTCSDTMDIVIPANGISGIDYDVVSPNCQRDVGFIQIHELIHGGSTSSIFLNELPIEIGEAMVLETGNYQLRAIDDFGCEIVDSFSVANLAQLITSQLQDTSIYRGQQTTLSIGNLLPSASLGQLKWSTSDSIVCNGCSEIIVQPSFTERYLLEILDQDGCEYRKIITVSVNQNRPFYVPNAVSPNADGVNDEFAIYDGKGLVQTVKSLQIFDKIGQLVYSTSDLAPDTPAPNFLEVFTETIDSEVFIYRLEVVFKANYSTIYEGEVTIIK